MSTDNEEKPLSYSELLLGNAMETIVEEAEKEIPQVSETQFINHVLPLLERPFYHSSMSNYVRYVGELTNPLHVTSDSDAKTILFTVPAIIQSTGVTLPATGAPTTDTTLKNIYAQGERGVDVNPMIANFMSKVAARPDMVVKLLDPLNEILGRYGRTIDISDENNVALKPAVEAAKAPDIAPDNSFTGEYE